MKQIANLQTYYPIQGLIIHHEKPLKSFEIQFVSNKRLNGTNEIINAALKFIL